MNNIILVLLLALVGGIIGWITNILAIKLLFRPLNPIKIPVLNIEILGLIPKRKTEIAENIGKVISTELLSIDDLIENSLSDDDKQVMIMNIKDKIKSIIEEKITFIPAPFRMMASPYIEKIVDESVEPAINDIGQDAIRTLKEKVDIQKIVEDKINELDLAELERIIISVAKSELKHIEILGLFLGFFIGLIQGLIVILL